jgi:peroxiredoxin
MGVEVVMARVRTMAALVLTGLLFATPAFALDAAPDFTLRDLESNEVTLSGLKGKVVVMSFWATWCGPCKEEMPHLFEMYKKYGEQGLVILSISTDDARSASKVKPFIMKMGYTFPVLLDRESTVVGTYNPAKTLPYTVVVDRDGNVAHRATGYNPGDEAELEKLLLPLLGVAAPTTP